MPKILQLDNNCMDFACMYPVPTIYGCKVILMTITKWQLQATLATPYAGLDRGGGGGGGGEGGSQFENGAKFLCLKGKGRTISSFLHQKCYQHGHKEPQNCNFQPPHAC